MVSPVKIWRRQKRIREILSKRGKILTWTKIFVSGSGFKKFAPYFVVLVELENKKKVVGQLVDWVEEENLFGKKVKAVLRKVREVKEEDVIPYGVKFVLTK